MSDSSQYADSSQARQLDRDLEARSKPDLRLVPNTIPPEQWAAQQRERDARQKESSRVLIKRGMAELEAFFGPGRK